MQVGEYLSYDLVKELQDTTMCAFDKKPLTKSQHGGNQTPSLYQLKKCTWPLFRGISMTNPRLKGIFVTSL